MKETRFNFRWNKAILIYFQLHFGWWES